MTGRSWTNKPSFRIHLLIALIAVALAAAVGCGGVAGNSLTPAPGPGTTGGTGGTGTSGTPSGSAQVTTYHYDVARTGANSAETTLTLANVNATQFGKLYSFSVDGQTYAQPLYLSGVTIGGAKHNVVFVATEHDSVYAFDADSNSNTPLWHRSFIDPTNGVTTVSYKDFPQIEEDIAPEIGITSTPVIDAATGTLYVVAKTKENGKFFQRLHALDITSGAEKANSPVIISPSEPGKGVVNDGAGNIVFDPLIANQRSALLLLNGTVYLAFASHGDFDPFLGWLVGYDAASLKQTIVFAPTPDGAGGGIWESGDGPAADSAGNIFVSVANGDYTANSGGRDYGDSFLKLSPSNGTLQVLDWFTPFNFQEMNDLDKDLGSGGLILLPDQSSGPAHLAIGGGKDKNLYVVNRDAMGHNHSADNSQIVQQVPLNGGLFGVPAVWGNHVYVGAVGANLQSYTLNGGQLTLSSSSAQMFGYSGTSPAVSSNGSSNGIVWALQVDQWDNGPAVLHAYDAADLTHELYNSSQAAGGRDTAGTAVKFTVPTVANGKVFVGGGGQITVYGLLSK